MMGGVEFPKIVSGGQTGADRAALDWAMAHGVPHGGWCPAGRLAEDGVIDMRYSLKETPQPEYLQRTEWNVRDSEATLIVSCSAELSGGSLATRDLAAAHDRPCLHLSGELEVAEAAVLMRDWLQDEAVTVLNIAGPRASGEPAVGLFIQSILDELWLHWE